MKFNQAHINTIINAKRNDNLVIFIGAGISKFSQSNSITFPVWGDLINAMKKDLDINESDYLKVAQLYYLKFGEYSLYEKLKSMIPLHANPSDIHEKIFKLNPKYVITTNWDNILEKTIEQNGHIYDIIRSDADLVKSILPRKLLKVHGDFSSHNVVFKEDDYLTYGDNFPLIENFLRHILSSYTVLFLGYSYSDYDLKIISKWIERRSDIAPPRFILTLKENTTENMYLKSHGIQAIFPTLNNNEIDYKDLYDNFLDRIYSEYGISNNLLSVVEVLSSDEEVEINDQVKIEVIDFLYEQLKGLLEFKVLLPEQITDVLSNCTVEYHVNCFGLWFHSSTLTTDYEESHRNIYKLFFQIIQSYEGYEDLKKDYLIYEKLKNVLKVFYLSNCLYITNQGSSTSDWISVKQFFSTTELYEFDKVDSVFDEFLDFSHPNKEMMGVYSTDKYKDGTNSYSMLIQYYNNRIYQHLKDKEFYRAVISMFNLDFINRKKKVSLDLNVAERFDSEDTEWRSKLEMYPPSTKKHMRSLNDFLNFNLLYRLYHDLTREVESASKNYLVKSNAYSSNDISLQLLHFIVLNEILIDEYTIFKDLMRLYAEHKFKILLYGKNNSKNIPSPFENMAIGEHDLFILIKYYEFKKIQTLLDKIYRSFVDKDVKIDCQKHGGYLLKTFENLLNLYKFEKNGVFSSRISESLVNIIIICSLVDWKDTELTNLVDLIRSSFIKHNMPSDAYKALNLFIFFNYKFFNISVEEMKPLLDIPLEKVLSGILSGLEFHAIDNDLRNLYGIFDETGIKYHNEALLKRVIGSLKPLDDTNYQRKIASKILIKYLFIIEERMVNQLHDYINSVRIKNWSRVEESMSIFDELTFNYSGLEVNKNFVEFLDNYIDNESQEITEDSRESIVKAEKIFGSTKRTKLLEFIKALNDKSIPEYTKLYEKYSA